MKLKGFVFVLALAALWPAAGNAATLHGVVVAKSHGTLLVAAPNGVVRSMHGTAAVGSRLDGAQVVGRASRARIHGVVVRQVGSTTFLASNRHLLAIRGGSSPAPAPGSVVNTTVGVQPNGELDEQSEDSVGQVAAGTLQIQATVTAVGTGTVTLSVNGQTLTMNLPNGLTLPASFVGQTVTLNVSLDQSGNQGDDDGGGGGGDGQGGNGGGDG